MGEWFTADAVDASIGVAVVDPDTSVVLADSGCPDEVSRHGVALFIARQTVADRRIDNLPMHEVFGCQYLQTRHVIERRRGHEVRIAHAYHVRVGVVVRQDRIRIARYGSADACRP